MDTRSTVTSRDVQSDNFKALTAAKLSRAEQLVMNAVLLAHARRQRDLSLNEICRVMEEQLGRRVNPNAISGRVTSLVDRRRLARAEPRACSVTGVKCAPVFAVAKQAELTLAKRVELGVVKARPDVHGAAQAAPIARNPGPSGMPPEVRARLAAIRQAAAQGKGQSESAQ